jgi:hypothetical protein
MSPAHCPNDDHITSQQAENLRDWRRDRGSHHRPSGAARAGSPIDGAAGCNADGLIVAIRVADKIEYRKIHHVRSPDCEPLSVRHAIRFILARQNFCHI